MDNYTDLSTFEMLDFSNKKYQSLPCMSEAKVACSAILYNKTNIVVLGGWNPYHRYLSTVEMIHHSTLLIFLICKLKNGRKRPG